MLFKDVAKNFINKKRGEVSDSTISSYKNILDNIEWCIGDMTMEEVTCSECLNFLAEILKKRNFTDYDIAESVKLVREIVYYYSGSKVYRSIIKTENRKTIKFISESKISNMIKIAKALIEHDNKAMAIVLALFAGLSVSEISALKWSDVDLINRTITVSKSAQRLPDVSSENCKGKKTKLTVKFIDARIVPMNYCLLEFFKKCQVKSEFVCANETNMLDPRNLELFIDRLFGYAMGDLRDHFCLEGIKKKIPIQIISKYVGVSVSHFCTRYGEYIECPDLDYRCEIEKVTYLGS